MDQKQNTNTLDNSELQRLMDLSECAMIIARQQPEAIFIWNSASGEKTALFFGCL